MWQVLMCGRNGFGISRVSPPGPVQHGGGCDCGFRVSKGSGRASGLQLQKQVPVVLCTTGLSSEQLSAVEKASQVTAILRSANMSLGVNLLLKLVSDAARVLAGSGFDMEIVEKHHNQKVDAPSGTALALADSMNQAMDGQYAYTCDRSTRRERKKSQRNRNLVCQRRFHCGRARRNICGQGRGAYLKPHRIFQAIFAKGAWRQPSSWPVSRACTPMTDVVDL